MLRSSSLWWGAPLAFVSLCLISIGNTEELWSNIRSDENQQKLQKFNEETANRLKSTAQPYVPGSPALLSPGLVKGGMPLPPFGTPQSSVESTPSLDGAQFSHGAPSSSFGTPSSSFGAPSSSAGWSPSPVLPSASPGVPLPSREISSFPQKAPTSSLETSSFKPPRTVGPDDHVDVIASDQIARSVLKFAQELSQQINANYRKTTIFSPLSIMSAMALLLLGSKGRSYSELTNLFGQTDVVKLHEQFGLMLKDVQQPTKQTTSPVRTLDNWHSDSVRRSLRNYPRNRVAPLEVHIANGLFLQEGYSLNPDYRQAIEQVYDSKVQELDFEKKPGTARYYINSWVENETKHKIDNILSEDIPQDTRIILANALYFKAMWEIDFIKGATKVEDFYPNGEGSQPVLPVEMMVGAGAFPYYESVELDCRIVGLPYHGNLSTMYIIQPKKSSVAQLNYLHQSLTADAIEAMISQMTRRSIIIAFPKMHLAESFKLSTVLQRMGIGGIFSPIQSDLSLIGARRATGQNQNRAQRQSNNGLASLYNLSAQRQEAAQSQVPTPPSDLLVSDILHKVDFVVNEQGTEAAAASAAILKKSGPEVLFRAETPFIVLVRHDLTKLPLFYGMINEPPTAEVSSSTTNLD